MKQAVPKNQKAKAGFFNIFYWEWIKVTSNSPKNKLFFLFLF